ncbi:hypothetical protein [Fodinicola feengrottensis]|uniref:hypothetical protein n=1 Tax=Fodinicola feengrottensis TaxID=435914 RepID=UPI0031D68BCB
MIDTIEIQQDAIEQLLDRVGYLEESNTALLSRSDMVEFAVFPQLSTSTDGDDDER